MSSRPAFLVYGCEGSGTRMLTKIFIAAGALGDGGHAQRFDKKLPLAEETEQPIVWRRSFPHAGKSPDIARMGLQLREAGWTPYGIVIVRDTLANVRAQVPDHAGNIEEAWEKNQREFCQMFLGLRGAGIPFEVFTYENIVARPIQMQHYVGDLPGLHTPQPLLEIKDANEKHWANWRPRPVQ